MSLRLLIAARIAFPDFVRISKLAWNSRNKRKRTQRHRDTETQRHRDTETTPDFVRISKLGWRGEWIMM